MNVSRSSLVRFVEFYLIERFKYSQGLNTICRQQNHANYTVVLYSVMFTIQEA